MAEKLTAEFPTPVAVTRHLKMVCPANRHLRLPLVTSNKAVSLLALAPALALALKQITLLRGL